MLVTLKSLLFKRIDRIYMDSEVGLPGSEFHRGIGPDHSGIFHQELENTTSPNLEIDRVSNGFCGLMTIMIGIMIGIMVDIFRQYG